MHNSFILPSLFVAFLWAIQTLAQKHTLHNIAHETSFAMFSVAYAIMMIFFIGYYKDLIHRDLKNITKPMFAIILTTTVFTFVANLLYYKILKHNGASITTALTSTGPLFVALLAFLVFGENIKPKQIAGIAAIIAGIALIS